MQCLPTFEMTLADYFRERLLQLADDLSPTPQEDTLWYTGNMLARFGDSTQLFSFEEGRMSIRPLALLYKDAYEAQAEWERCLLLRQLGDLSLFLGALFPETYARKGINKDYFIGMGGGAYDYLAENAQDNRHIFAELANMFARILELIAKACEKQSAFDAADILQLLQRWRQNNDPRLAEQLLALGIPLPPTNSSH